MDQQRKQWPLYEVFIRARSGLEHKHVGSIHAVDARMAIDGGLRGAASSVAVVGTGLDETVYIPLWEKADELGAVVPDHAHGVAALFLAATPAGLRARWSEAMDAWLVDVSDASGDPADRSRLVPDLRHGARAGHRVS